MNGTEQIISTDKAVDIKVPTKTSELINDSGFSTVTTSSVGDITFILAQFNTYSEFLSKLSTDYSSLTITEGSTVIIKEGEVITTTAPDGTVTNSDYPYGLYRWDATTNEWVHQDFLIRKEFRNHAEDTEKHVSVGDRYSWDNKADGMFEITDIDISSTVFKGQVKYIVDSAYLYNQLTNMKLYLDGQYESSLDFEEHENNLHTDVLHITSSQQSDLHGHANKTSILDNLSEDSSGNLTFKGYSVSAGKTKATKIDLGQVIVGSGIEVKPDGTIYIDWYSETDNGDGTSTVNIGGVKYTKDNTSGDITGGKVGGVDIKTEMKTDASGNVIKTETVGGTTTTTTTKSDGTSTVVIDNGGAITTVNKDSSGNVVSTVVGNTVVSGKVEETKTSTVTDTSGNIIDTTVTTTTTPVGQTEKTETIITKPTGETTETVTTVTTSGSDVNVGMANGETVTTEKDSTGTVISTTTEPVMKKDGEDNLITQNDLNDLFTSIDGLW